MVTPECLVRWSMVVESNENSNPRFDQSKECNLNVMTFHYSHSLKVNHDRPHHRFRITFVILLHFQLEIFRPQTKSVNFSCSLCGCPEWYFLKSFFNLIAFSDHF